MPIVEEYDAIAKRLRQAEVQRLQKCARKSPIWSDGATLRWKPRGCTSKTGEEAWPTGRDEPDIVRTTAASYPGEPPRILSDHKTDAKTPLRRGSRITVRATVAGSITPNITHSGALVRTATRKNGTVRRPTTRIVAQAGPSSARISPSTSPQLAQLSANLRYERNSRPLPHRGHRPQKPRLTAVHRSGRWAASSAVMSNRSLA